MSSYGEQLEDSVWSDDPDAFSVSDRNPPVGTRPLTGAGPPARTYAPYAPLAPKTGGSNGTVGGWSWFGGGAWYQDWRLWSIVLCIVVLVAYLIYAHSADERVRQDHEKRYTLAGRGDHLDSMVASLERGHVLDEKDTVPPPDNVRFARRNARVGVASPLDSRKKK